MTSWGTAEFTVPEDAIAVDHAGVAITAVVKDDYTVIAWAVNVRGATWAECDALARQVAERLRGWMDGVADFTYEPDAG